MVGHTELRGLSARKAGVPGLRLPLEAPRLRASPALTRQALLAAQEEKRAQRPATPANPPLRSAVLAELAADHSRQRRIRLAAVAIVTAITILLWALWSQTRESKSAPFQPIGSQLVRRPIQPSATESLGTTSRFAGALNRLNEDLIYAQGVPPEQTLSAVRASEGTEVPPACDFVWNNGQPALLYHAGTPLDRSLDGCAGAVENYLFGQTKAPAANGRGE
jgi:hypothetical protein